MARVHNSIFASGVTRSGMIVIADKPMFDDHRRVTNIKKSHQDSLQEATTYANFAKYQEVYMDKAQGTGITAYTIALADWCGSPKGLGIDGGNWTGEIGETVGGK